MSDVRLTLTGEARREELKLEAMQSIAASLRTISSTSILVGVYWIVTYIMSHFK